MDFKMETSVRNEEGFFAALKKVAEKVRALDEIVVIHHYDADGLTSGSIAIKALEREGKKVEHLCLKQLYKENIAEIKALGKNYLFVDFGSGQLDYLKADLGEENTFILDHHEPIKVDGKLVEMKYHINPLLYGIDGGKEISGAGVTFFFAIALNEKNKDLGSLAIVGALGDMQDYHGSLTGMNRKIVDIALEQNVLKIKEDLRLYGRISRPLVHYLLFASNPILPGLTANRENCQAFLKENNIPVQFAEQWLSYEDLAPEDKIKLSSALITYLAMREVPEWKIKSLIGEVYTLVGEEEKSPLRDGKEFATVLNSTGRHARPEVGLGICLGDRDPLGIYGEAMALLHEHRVALRKGIEYVEQNGVQEKNAYYFFDAGEEIQDSLVGIIAGMLYGSVIEENKPIIALAKNEDDTVKISGRATAQLVRNGLNLGGAFKELGKEMKGVEGGGHCLHPNTLVQKSNGAICKISEIKELDCLIGRQNAKLISAKCNKLFKTKKDKIIFIKTPCADIMTSKDHRFFKYENFKLVETKAKDLKEKDFILGTKQIIFKGKDMLLKNNSFIYLKKEGILEFKNARFVKGLTRKELHSKLSLVTQNVGNLGDLERLSSHRILKNCLVDYLYVLGINKQNFFKKFIDKQFECNTKTLNKEIAWLIGYIQGDGYISKKRIECKEPSEQILKIFEKNIFKNFNLHSTIVDMKTYKKIRVYSADLCRFFEVNFPESKLLSGSLKAPIKIMCAKNEIVASYLRGIFDADGGAFDRFVHLDLIDEHLLKTIQLLLLRFGILSGLRKSTKQKNSKWKSKQGYRLDITDFDSLKIYAKEIGFTKNSKKALALKIIMEKQSNKKRNSMILSPITYGLMRSFVREHNIPRKIFSPQIIYKGIKTKRMNYTTLKLKFIDPVLKNPAKINLEALKIIKTFNDLCFKGNFKFYEIKKKTIQSNNNLLFDLSVPKIENFMANGLIVHNSIAAGCKVDSIILDEFLKKLDEKIYSQLH